MGSHLSLQRLAVAVRLLQPGLQLSSVLPVLELHGRQPLLQLPLGRLQSAEAVALRRALGSRTAGTTRPRRESSKGARWRGSEGARGPDRPGKLVLQLPPLLKRRLLLGAQGDAGALQGGRVPLVGPEELLPLGPQAAPLLLPLTRRLLPLGSQDRALLLEAAALRLHGLQLAGCGAHAQNERRSFSFTAVRVQQVVDLSLVFTGSPSPLLQVPGGGRQVGPGGGEVAVPLGGGRLQGAPQSFRLVVRLLLELPELA
ncbi:hypothetical protein EYF80_065043 [Liparis tanakae]|uniref:Uncharacterized protein n=1 Tax=Liparis tanakae TaxID=230148 RepID=A0A4Z2E7U6_9TELE|nr:hypothetical protein EYF80_065043 [Liparis tanakae]